MSKSLIGTGPDQCPTNADLGTMAFQDAESVRVGNISVDTGMRLTGLSVYADNAAALAGGLTAGAIYRTSTGVLMVVY